MVIKKEDVKMLKIKGKAITHSAFDSDYNVPDVKPDIGRLIQSKGNVSVDEVRLSDGRAFLKGMLNVDLLYVADGEGKVHSLAAKFPLEEALNLEGVSSGDKICMKWEIEDLSIHVIHSRKISVKAIIALQGQAEEINQLQLPVELEDSEISVRKKTINLMNLCVHKKDTLRIKDEINLVSNRPNIRQILWDDIAVRGLDLRTDHSVVHAKGEISVFILYEGDDEGGTIQWIEHILPFSGDIECTGCQEGLIPNIESSIMNQNVEVKPDADGEERIFVLDIVLELNMRLYKEEEHTVILDAYSPLKECILKGKEEQLDTLLIRNFSRCRVNERVEVKETQGKILQLCHSKGKVKIEKTKIKKDGIEAEGILQLKILYIVTDDAMPFYSMEAMLPFKHLIEAKGIKERDIFYIQAELEQLSVTMADSNELEIRAAIGLNTLVITGKEELIIQDIEEQKLDFEKIQQMPGMIVYMVKNGDTLWDIAKKYYTTIEEILEVNELKEENLTVGQPLLLIKKMEKIFC